MYDEQKVYGFNCPFCGEMIKSTYSEENNETVITCLGVCKSVCRFNKTPKQVYEIWGRTKRNNDAAAFRGF